MGIRSKAVYMHVMKNQNNVKLNLQTHTVFSGNESIFAINCSGALQHLVCDCFKYAFSLSLSFCSVSARPSTEMYIESRFTDR